MALIIKKQNRTTFQIKIVNGVNIINKYDST